MSKLVLKPKTKCDQDYQIFKMEAKKGLTEYICFPGGPVRSGTREYFPYCPKWYRQRHTKRQATQHGCLPSLLGDGDKGQFKYSVQWGKVYVLDRLEQTRQNKNLLYWHDKPNKPTKEGLLSFVLFESPFTSVSKASRGHPSLVSLGTPPPTLGNMARLSLYVSPMILTV